MPRKLSEKEKDEQLGPDSVRLEATEKAGKLKGAKRVVGANTAKAMLASGRWQYCDARYVPAARAAAASAGSDGGGSGSA